MFFPIPDQAIWFIDYDLTLYPASEKKVLHSLDGRINSFIQNHLGCDLQAATELRMQYWKDYGTTLAGLMVHYAVSPDSYFDFIQNGPEIIDPEPIPGLRTFLTSLAGQKFIFTNGRKDWALRGVRSMKLEGVFNEVYGLGEFNWVGKPTANPYRILEGIYGTPERFVFLDDSLENIQMAQKRGWNVIWVHPDAPGSEQGGIACLMDLKKKL